MEVDQIVYLLHVGISILSWLSLIRPGSFDVEDATTLSWSSAAVSE